MARPPAAAVGVAVFVLAACSSSYPGGHRPADGGGGSGGGGGTGVDCGAPVPLEEACVRIGEAGVERGSRCGAYAPEDLDAWRAVARHQCAGGISLVGDLPARVAAGGVDYDGAGLACCLLALATASCDEPRSSWGCLAAAFEPRSGLGEACGSHLDCRDGLCAVHACSPTCLPYPDPGEPCFEGFLCNGTCDLDADPPTCLPWPGEGQVCNGICAGALACIPGPREMVCGRWVEVGERCGPGRGCHGACEGIDASGWGTCRPGRGPGEPCDPMAHCAEGLFCGTDGVCRAVAGPGEACRPEEYSGCRAPYRCAPGTATCSVGPFPGEPCGAGGYCHLAVCEAGTCVPWEPEDPQPGEPCPGEDFWCGDLLICENRQCVEGCR